MITPSGIPQFTGDFDQLDKDVSALQSDAIGIRNGGADVHSRFQMLGAFYVAPEAEDLFSSTRPVMDNADGFATKLETAAAALDTYSIEARPLAERLKHLRARAIAFVDSVEGDDDWAEDEDKVHRHQELMDGVSSAQTAFQEAERRAASKISALVGGPKFVQDDGSHTVNKKTVMYGYGLDVLEHAKELPWGTPEEQTYEPWSASWFGHGAKTFVWDGLVKDNIVGGLDGLWTLAGGHGSDKAGDAWGGLGDVLGGIGQYTISPYDWAMDKVFGPAPADPDSERQKKAAREFFKGLVAWDKWDEDPVRASATVVFNVFTLGAGPLASVSKTAEAGGVAKTAGVAAKVGEFIDPVNMGLKATGQAVSKLPKLSDLTSRLLPATKAASADAHGVHSVIELGDGSKVLVQDGKFIAYDKDGNLVSDQPKAEQPSAGRVAPEPTPPRQPAMAGAASRSPHVTAHAGDDLTPGVGQDAVAGHSRTHSTSPSAGDSAVGSGARHAGGSDVPPPRTGGGGGVPTGHSGGGPDDLGRAGDDAADSADAGPDSDGSAGGRHPEAQRPAFMREGPNPYGPRGSLSLEQIEEIQVYRANHEPGYVEHYYRKDGTRKLLERYDESGYTPPQLARLSDDVPWGRAKDVPAPPKPHFLDDDYVRVGADTVSDPNRLRVLQKAAEARYHAIQWDNLVSDWKADAARAHELHHSIDSAAEWGEAKGTYKESHTQMGEKAEEFGETAAEHHYIAEHHPDFKSEPLLGPKSGNDQFDQVWTHEDGRVVVIEAKSSTDTELGRRTLPDGRQVSQGSREYFLDIIDAMRKRGERDLVRDLRRALRDGKLEYVVVKGEKNTGTYTGYRYRRFDISKGTLP
ncbi:hypothetical protein ACGF0K_00825 [Streptomyces sp. NPDC048156]|uniref:hypothetical protein n=1 Tax=Streptomyces sp. NPDC048156 TaxID=3365502 RepID=UPI0037112559